ncbi:hypothetical protein GJ744_006517 [Endocarpon pusillum]|uniref:ubiquitinyl hydrolase 1 n=1 Tax=Endocarpon pusillum TaxID=364733 RepID=A0A8H7ARI2_9EURO|nr:hypothetical protein GJ744_006517 [Endocarpon pusillum]
MLMTMLEANGHRVFPTLLRKHVRDDVCWTDGAERPWRRCPYWLVLRVGLERHLCRLHGGEAGKAHYKFLLCLALAGLVEDALEHLSPEILALLNAKLTRRIVKLEVDKDRVSPNTRFIYETLLNSVRPLLRKITSRTKQQVEGEWNRFKGSIRRRTPRLQHYAQEGNLRLTLPNSGPYLHRVLSSYQCMGSAPAMSGSYQLPSEFDVSAARSPHFKAFARHYYSLSDLEVDVEESLSSQSGLIMNPKKCCMQLAAKINAYINDVGSAYDRNPEQKSVMLLTVMELWMSMDQAATKLFDLLRDYSPGIPPEILEVLQLSNLTDLHHLQVIEEYLRDRHTKCNFSRRTIFDDPVKGRFSDRYFQESQDSQMLQELQQDIKEWAEAARQRKEKEWQHLSSEFEDLERSVAQAACLYMNEDFRVVHDDKHCRKCYLQRKARRMEIEIHEHPLPSDPVQANAVVFELGCPKAFAAYRNSTWKILGSLARPKPVQAVEPRLMVSDYSGLSAFVQSTSEGISLGSTTKSFHRTHYKCVRFPAALEDVCLTNGLKWGYFDTATKAWPGRHAEKPTFAHHCQMTLPPGSPFSFMQFSNAFAVDSDGPSSYEVLASQTRCPSGLNVQEFTAYQTLFSGKSRHWPQMLIELASSNLNFSSEATALLMVQLALQAGPFHKSDPLRTVHRIFRDEFFCRRLFEQINKRLDEISSNWREINCMQMLLTLILKMCSIGPELVIGEALKVLERIRAATFKWTSQLRSEIHRSTDAGTSQRCSRYAFWAALLCRKTFIQYVWDVDTTPSQDRHFAALRCFIECSITLQDNLFGDPAALPVPARNALIADLKMTYRIRFVLLRSLMASTKSLESAIDSVWPQSEGQIARSYSPLESPEYPKDWWVKSTIRATEGNQQQTIHYHLLGGHLLVDGQPIGKLPAKHGESVVLEGLFGKQSLLTYPSGRPGMSYVLAFPINGHQIHLGFRNKDLIVQAYICDTVLEFVPPKVFGDESNFDLPASLVENSVHWLDLRTGVLEVRQRPAIWNFKPGNWRLDLNTRKAERRNSALVDPPSRIVPTSFIDFRLL